MTKNKKILKYIDKNIKYIYIPICIIFGITLGISNAEQIGSSPNTGGAQSVLMRSYNLLLSKGDTYGSSSSPDFTNDWGTYWNRIMYSATWEPGGTAISSNILSDKTFVSSPNDRSIQTGTKPSFDIDYSLQQYVEYDDAHASDYTGEESEWIKTSSVSGANVWYDTRTGLYWSYSLGSHTNSFSAVSTGYCEFFNTGTYPTRGEYGTSGTDPDCGNAINACAVLSLASTEGQSADTDWYLPSKKEAQTAYINGMFNQAGSTFTTSSIFWVATDEFLSSGTSAWRVAFRTGYTYHDNKTSGWAVRCVRRD